MSIEELTGIGDSNLNFDGMGWAGGFGTLGVYAGSFIDVPGGSSRDVLWPLRYLSMDPPPKGAILVNLGINDVIDKIGPVEFCRNHLKIKEEVEAHWGAREWVWMPSHYTGSWKLEILRYALRITAWWHGIRFVNLRRFKKVMRFYYNSPSDKLHLNSSGYSLMSLDVWAMLEKGEKT